MASATEELESARIEALTKYRIFNTAPELVFDQLTNLASRLAETPIAGISFMGRRHLYFKAKIGIREMEVPRETSYCNLVLEKRALVAIENTESLSGSAEDRFSVGATMVRFYTGVPLINEDGHVLGCLFVMDHLPRVLSPEQIQSLKNIARLVLMQLELRRIRVGFEERYPTAAGPVSALGLELRTPMHGIFGGLEILSETKLDAEQRSSLKLAQRAAEKLFRTVSLVLQMSQDISFCKQKNEKRPGGLF
jgi:GAF domain-containing protein